MRVYTRGTSLSPLAVSTIPLSRRQLQRNNNQKSHACRCALFISKLMHKVISKYILCHTVYPPTPNPPYVTNKGSTWVQVAWNALNCDGGYQITAYDVEYRETAPFSYSYTTAGRVSGLNYVIHNLFPNTEYHIRVQAVSRISFWDTPSPFITVTTHPEGI